MWYIVANVIIQVYIYSSISNDPEIVVRGAPEVYFLYCVGAT
jgi:hypothetical protein